MEIVYIQNKVSIKNLNIFLILFRFNRYFVMKLEPNSTKDNTQLWQRLLNGDATALEIIYKKNAAFLTTYGYRLTQNKEIINDAIQDVFINLWQKRMQLPVVKNSRAYLLKSLRNRILRILESRTLTGNGEQPNEAIQDSFEQRLILEELAEERLTKLNACIQKLPTRQKEVINLRYFQNLKTEEIAEILDINYQSVSNLLYKGIKGLKKQIRLPQQ